MTCRIDGIADLATRWWPRLLALSAILVIVGLALPVGGGRGNVEAATTLAGSQGSDASLTATPSAVSVSGHGSYSGLQLKVNQTANLVDQAVSVTWTGGTPTYSGATVGGPFQLYYSGDFLQMMECWSANATTDPTPEQCEFGGENANIGAYPVNELTHAYQRTIAVNGWTCGASAPAGCMDYSHAFALATSSNGARAYVDPNTGWVVDPFLAVDGACGRPPCLVESSVNYNCCQTLPWQHSFDQNPYFNYTTTNEVDFARSFGDGSGQQLFSVASGLKAPGLGCGAPSLTNPDGSSSMPQCWLVVVPRATPGQENLAGDAAAQLVVDTSPLAPSAWANHISIPLGFAPLDAACPIGANVRRIVGSELAAPAVASWQPTLCQTTGNPPYSYAALSDDSARSQLLGAAAGGAGMAVVSNPIDPSVTDATNPMVYAPLTLSGVVIGVNIQRIPARPGGVDVAEEVPFAGTQVTHVFLTPRLVAKLLTESYQGQIYELSASSPGDHKWAVTNPYSIVEDPDFLQFNPEFAELRQIDAADASGLVVEEPSSDGAALVWNWILSDPEASAWLGGTPDPWGMTVNPYYSANATANPSGVAFGQPAPNGYPKADPYCYKDLDTIGGTNQTARPLCIQDWSPYVNTMRDAAANTRAANSGAKLIFQVGAPSPDTAWGANGPQVTGQHFLLSITDTADAARYGLQTAALSRSGDDGANRQFVAPDSAGLTAGEGAMKTSSVAGVLVPNPGSSASGAYPLTMLTYAAVAPDSLDQTARQDYASFVKYAAGPGQSPGFSLGSLPPGYVSLPSGLAAEATSAAATILNPPSPTTTTTTTAPTSTTTTTATTSTVATSSQTTAGTTVQQPSAAASPPVVAVPTVSTRPGPSTTAPPPPPVSPSAVTLAPVVVPTRPAASRSPATPVGYVRFAVPLGVVLGLVAAAGGIVSHRSVARPF